MNTKKKRYSKALAKHPFLGSQKSLISGKKAVSEMVTYILLIAVAISMAGLVYGWLKFYVQKPFPEESCPEVSLAIIDYNCTGKVLNMTIQNRGRFDVDGYTMKINNGTGSYTLYDMRYVLNYVPLKMESGNFSTGIFNYSVFNKIASAEIEAISGFDKYGRPILCEESVLKQDLTGC